MPKVLSNSDEISIKNKKENEKYQNYDGSIQTPSITKVNSIIIEKPKNTHILKMNNIQHTRVKSNASANLSKQSNIKNSESIEAKYSLIKGAQKELMKINNIYLNSKDKLSRIRGNIQIDSSKSASSASLSPKEILRYAKRIDINSPYSRSLNKQKIHLPYLRKQRRPVPPEQSSINLSKHKNERVKSNSSLNNSYDKRSIMKADDIHIEINQSKKNKPRLEDFHVDYSPILFQK